MPPATEEEALAHPGVSWGIRAWKDATNSSRDTRPSWQMSRRRIQAKTLIFQNGVVSEGNVRPRGARGVIVDAVSAPRNGGRSILDDCGGFDTKRTYAFCFQHGETEGAAGTHGSMN